MTREGAALVIRDEAGRLLLVRENYDRRRYGYPGGAVEVGETPEDSAIRETIEETGVIASLGERIGIYRLEIGLTVHLFSAEILSGTPAVPPTGEIAEVGWFAPGAIPRPVTNILHHSLADVLAGRRGVVRLDLPRLN